MTNEEAIDAFTTQLESPTLVNVADIERALTQFVAEKLNLTVDEDIFRGALPVGYDGFEIAIVGERLKNEPSKTMLNVWLRGIHKNRDYVMQTLSNFAKYLPIYGENVNEITFSALFKEKLNFLTFADDGKIKTEGLLTFKAYI